MARCSTCGNEYEKCFAVEINEQRYLFDCFECAIYLLSPCCVHCGCRVIGHGFETNGHTYCCPHCARESGVTEQHASEPSSAA